MLPAHRVWWKKFAVQFHQHSASNCADKICRICKVKFANLMRCLPKLCAICQMSFATEIFSSCSREKAAQICWWNWPLVDAMPTQMLMLAYLEYKAKVGYNEQLRADQIYSLQLWFMICVLNAHMGLNILFSIRNHLLKKVVLLIQ